MLDKNPAFHYWVFLCIFFFLKTFLNSMIQGYSRFKGNTFINPEDTERFADSDKEVIQKYRDLDERAARCWRNDLENIPFFLLLSLALVILGGNPQYCLAYFITYASIRLLHTYFYMKAKQPHRGAAFALGNLVTMSIVGHCIYIISLHY
ncbi:MAPEG family protein [Candidatus Uabimicrobium sp. HlEnr_7]|uniref:MAPEG family protein n=1 Tax=Candidatus Uabimicrobium helgolandensis TaxID=3095367 RepID=UPI003558BB04